jgi:hypothetical protein
MRSVWGNREPEREAMKRKMPKNQRPYATPSGKKARLVVIGHAEAKAILADEANISVPSLVRFRSGTGIAYMAMSDHMAKWRASQVTSTGEQ